MHCIHVGYVGVEVNIHYAELADFFLGWFGLDITADDGTYRADHEEQPSVQAEEPSKARAKEPVARPVPGPAPPPAREPAKEPTKEPAKEPNKKPAKAPTTEPVKIPVKTLGKESPHSPKDLNDLGAQP